MRAWLATGLCVSAVALAGFARATAESPSVERSAPERVQLLDVPYVPQSGALCGGAALAMVLRFWGRTGVMAEDFAALAEPGQAGIQAGALVEAVEADGWTALSLAGTAAVVEDHLAQGRPVIALLRAGADSYHYVVLVAWANGWVIVHDPNVGPFRAVREAEFESAWSGSGNWALLVLPPQSSGGGDVPNPAAADLPVTVAPEGCDTLVEAGILLARQGDFAGAELGFLAAQALYPGSALPLRERAGLRFRAEDWEGASRLAEGALALDASDAHACRLLAGSRFLLGDVDGALRAWNRLSEPLTDLTRIDGLERIRYAAAAAQLDLPPGQLLTPQSFRRACRRLEELPARSASRLSLRPLPAGIVQVNATVLERPRVFDGPWDVGSAAIKALLRHDVTIEVASPTGNGELWSAGWSWWRERPRVLLALAVPAAGGRPGVWCVEGFWERQTYAARVLPEGSGPAGAGTSLEERRRTSLSFADWFGPDFRLGIGAALDAWADRGTHLSLSGSAETRWAGDRLALRAELARWRSLENRAPFGTGGLSLEGCSRGVDQRDGWQGRLGVFHATPEAPLALWSGAGTGDGRAPLLRAHPLLAGGVIEGRVFGRTLAHATIERQAWFRQPGAVQFGWILFVDGARPWDTGRAGRVPWQVDGGAGLRLKGLGVAGQLRIDAARGFADGNSAVSVGWQIP